MLTITIIWIVAGPLSVVFGACAAMGAMCEGPCGVGPGAIDLSAGGVTLIATAVLWLTATSHLAARWLAAPALVTLLLALLGHTPRTIADRLAYLADLLGDLLHLFRDLGSSAATTGTRALPATTLGWGLLAVAAAFALLLAGGCLSLLKRPRA